MEIRFMIIIHVWGICKSWNNNVEICRDQACRRAQGLGLCFVTHSALQYNL